MNKWRLKWQKLAVLAIATCLSLSFSYCKVNSQAGLSPDLPPLKAHSLPEFFLQWQAQTTQSDYFEQIESTPLGYLVWSQFPVKVYVEQTTASEKSAANQRFQQWTATAKEAIAEWQVYFPFTEVTQPEAADIMILRSQPKREVKLNPDTGLYDIPRAVAAQTNYEFYSTENPTSIALRMTIQISPNFTGVSLLATVRHELGHALGIWGHSPEKADALYFSQVSNPPTISPRDLNTLKKVYQQPTRLGWEMPN